MVIGAHPDDPEVNMAGTIAKFAESGARGRIPGAEAIGRPDPASERGIRNRVPQYRAGAGRLNQSSEPHLRVLRVARRFEK